MDRHSTIHCSLVCDTRICDSIFILHEPREYGNSHGREENDDPYHNRDLHYHYHK